MEGKGKFEILFEKVLQGLIFWVAYKRQYFRSYHFSEGALTSELYTLINSFKPDNYRLIAECHYARMFPYMESDKLGRKKSVDILLYSNPATNTKEGDKKKKANDKKVSKDFKISKDANLFLIEVKKMESKSGKIIEDFEKIHDYLKENPNARGFVVLLNQEYIKDSFDIVFEKKKFYRIIDKSRANGKEVISKKFIRGKYLNPSNKNQYNYSLIAKPARAAKTIAGGLNNSLYCVLIEVKVEK